MRHRPLIAALAILAVLIACGAGPGVQRTDAAWADSEFGAGTFTAATLSSPTNMTCTVANAPPLFLTFQSVTITWVSAYAWAPASGPKSTLTASSSTKTSTVTGVTTTGTGPYTHSVTLNQALLESLVTNLLGSTTTFKVTNVAGTNWVSSSQTKTLTMTLAGLGAACS